MGGSANGRKGAETERMVAKYLRPHWPEVDRRLREGRADDQGDLDGVPDTCTQVKYWAKPRMQEWVDQTLKQRENKRCQWVWIISRVKYQPVEKWDAFLPLTHLGFAVNVREASGWVRMDLGTAVAVMKELHRGPSLPSWSTTG